MALSVQNTVAVLQGFFGKKSEFIRTPKSSDQHDDTNYLIKRVDWLTLLELFFLFYFLTGVSLSFYLHDYFLLLFFVMMISGLGILLYQTAMSLRSKLTLKPVALKSTIPDSVQ
ncbi:MAG: hypothetical protein C4330_00990 [Chitinophagaceae bacterium]